MSDDTAGTTEAADDPAAPLTQDERIALRIAVLKARAERDAIAVREASATARPSLAAIRDRGKPQQEARLPGGPKLGLISILAGQVIVRPDEDVLMLCVRPHDLEEYVTPAALQDKRVLKLLLDNDLSELVERRIKPDVRRELQQELEERGGWVFSRVNGEREDVATITRLPATGEFRYRPNRQAQALIREAIDAGLITEDGEIPGQPDDWAPAATVEAALAAPVPDDYVTDPVPLFADEHGALNPEKAAQYAMVASLGRGFTTPPIEAYRMIRGGGVSADRARAWLAEHGLDPDDPREGKDTPWPLPGSVSRARPGQKAPAVRVSKTGHAPTDEQAAVIAMFKTGDSTVVEAGAGAGKTSTLVMAAEAIPGRRGIYVAFNKAISEDAKKRFPRSVRCSTAHALAMGAVGRQYQHRLNGPRLPARDAAKILGITSPVKVGDRMLAPERIARLAIETIDRFCRSADEQPAARHVPRKPGFEDRAVYAALGAEILPVAQRGWRDIGSLAGKLRFEHGHYLKLWQLSHPQLGADFIMFDEAQDASPVILDVIVRQTESQLIAVGDRNQAINGWNGAVDAMDKFPDSQRLTLSQSFRFGPAVAVEANKWLTVLGASLRITGFSQIPSVVASLDDPNATLCRTNAEAMIQAMRAMEAGRPTAIVGGGAEIRALAEAAASLKEGRPTSHPELFAFNSWAEVQDHAENDSSGSDLKVLVALIDDHGPEKIIAMTDRLVDEAKAQTIVSTAHKAKGREWDTVRIAGDFREPRRTPDDPDPEVPADMAMLSYVAVTRAKLTLDRAGLAWVDHFLPAGQVRAA